MVHSTLNTPRPGRAQRPEPVDELAGGFVREQRPPGSAEVDRITQQRPATQDGVTGGSVSTPARGHHDTRQVQTTRGSGSWARRVREKLVDSPTSLGAKARMRRWDVFASLFPDIEQLRVVDLGGTVESWRRAPVQPREVVVVNLLEPGDADTPRLVPVLGDACNARAVLEEDGIDTAFDLVFSNSLLEHVGGHANRSALAREVRALAPRHWVQTPYRFFPVEPHWVFPMMQFLPVAARTRVAKDWPLVHTRPASAAEALADVQWTELIGVTELRGYFPDSQVVKERMAGLVKSIVAVRP